MTRMETNLFQETTLSFGENSLHFIVENGKLWCVFTDACRALEIVDTEKAASYLNDTEKKFLPCSSEEMEGSLCVDLFGLYSLCVNAETPQAVSFQHWFTDIAPSVLWSKLHATSHATSTVSMEDCLQATEQLCKCMCTCSGNYEERVLNAILAILHQGGFHVAEV